MTYTPRFSGELVAQLREWHEGAYQEMHQRGNVEQVYLGRRFQIPATVFAPTPMSDLLGSAVLEHVKPDDRVLDMGTGCGVNAILAASVSCDVTGVDINPDAIAAAYLNAHANGVAHRTRFFLSDVFDAVGGTFDLIVCDPPFRWFRPRDVLEASIADENYAALRRFIAELPARLNPHGRVLLFFGTTGDAEYLSALIAEQGLRTRRVASRDLTRDGRTVTYFTDLLTCEASAG